MPRQNPNPDPPYSDEEDELFEPVVSATECTGLIPAIPSTEEELESMEELYDLPINEDTKKAD